MNEVIETALTLDADTVWVRPDATDFAYTDGVASERYLEWVFRCTSDLSSDSAHLEARAKDWPSEYHLSRARAQLLRAFAYDRSSRVLEVGSGCGAITRFLGETFAEVVAVEGSHERARLARLRTRDLDNVSIVCSPFQELAFKTRFDLIFCIGVFEYSSSFVDSEKPHEEVLRYLSDLLAPGGVLVLAIENRLGLKYFCSSAEDHTGVMFDGIEGYPRSNKVQTFGHGELTQMLSGFFREVKFFYPLPDYKMASCVISQRMIDEVDVSELFGSFRSVDYGSRARRPLFSEQLAWSQIAKNSMIPAFANSFLVFAGNDRVAPVPDDWLGVLYSNRRRHEFSTVTRFSMEDDFTVRVVKSRADGTEEFFDGPLGNRSWSGPWLDGPSLQLTIARLARSKKAKLEEIVAPSKAWFDDLHRTSKEQDGVLWVEGSRLDALWRNCFVRDGRCEYIDQEWVWRDRLPLQLVVARGLFYFAKSLLDSPGLSPALQGMPVWRFITLAARTYGLRPTWKDLRELVRFEVDVLGRNAGLVNETSRGFAWRHMETVLALQRRFESERAGSSRTPVKRALGRLRRLVVPGPNSRPRRPRRPRHRR